MRSHSSESRKSASTSIKKGGAGPSLFKKSIKYVFSDFYLINSNEETKGDAITGMKRKNKRNYKEKLNIKIDLSRQEGDNVVDPISNFIQDQVLSAPI